MEKNLETKIYEVLTEAGVPVKQAKKMAKKTAEKAEFFIWEKKNKKMAKNSGPCTTQMYGDAALTMAKCYNEYREDENIKKDIKKKKRKTAEMELDKAIDKAVDAAVDEISQDSKPDKMVDKTADATNAALGQILDKTMSELFEPEMGKMISRVENKIDKTSEDEMDKIIDKAVDTAVDNVISKVTDAKIDKLVDKTVEAVTDEELDMFIDDVVEKTVDMAMDGILPESSGIEDDAVTKGDANKSERSVCEASVLEQNKISDGAIGTSDGGQTAVTGNLNAVSEAQLEDKLLNLRGNECESRVTPKKCNHKIEKLCEDIYRKICLVENQEQFISDVKSLTAEANVSNMRTTDKASIFCDLLMKHANPHHMIQVRTILGLDGYRFEEEREDDTIKELLQEFSRYCFRQMPLTEQLKDYYGAYKTLEQVAKEQNVLAGNVTDARSRDDIETANRNYAQTGYYTLSEDMSGAYKNTKQETDTLFKHMYNLDYENDSESSILELEKTIYKIWPDRASILAAYFKTIKKSYADDIDKLKAISGIIKAGARPYDAYFFDDFERLDPCGTCILKLAKTLGLLEISEKYCEDIEPMDFVLDLK